MIQCEKQFFHSSNDKAFEALYGVNTDNEGFSFEYPFRALVLCRFFNLSPNLSFINSSSYETVIKLLLAFNNTII
jgi:hypothetical protein